jgi:capsular polysaccharide biosynthesis protein
LVFAGYERDRHIDEAALMGGRIASNYFHWLIEYLPRLFLIEQVPSLAGRPLLVTDDLPPAGQEALEVLAGELATVTVNRNDRVRVDRLAIPGFHTYFPDTTQLPWIRGSCYSVALLLELRRRALVAARPDQSMARRVMLVRESWARGLSNAEEVATTASDHGLELVDPACLGFLDQVRLFAESQLIVGVGGAAFANLVFASPGAEVVGLVSEQLHDFCIYGNLADLVGARFRHLTGRTDRPPSSFRFRRDFMHADFRIDAKFLDRVLADLQSAKEKPLADNTSAHRSLRSRSESPSGDFAAP